MIWLRIARKKTSSLDLKTHRARNEPRSELMNPLLTKAADYREADRGREVWRYLFDSSVSYVSDASQREKWRYLYNPNEISVEYDYDHQFLGVS